MTPREQRAEELRVRSGKRLDDYSFEPGAQRQTLFGLDTLRAIEDEALRAQAWELYWLLEAAARPSDRRAPSDDEEQDRRHP